MASSFARAAFARSYRAGSVAARPLTSTSCLASGSPPPLGHSVQSGRMILQHSRNSAGRSLVSARFRVPRDLAEGLEEPQWRGGAIVDAYVRVDRVNVPLEALGKEAAAVAGDQERRLRLRPVM